MPERQRVKRYESTEIQGEGSYVICSAMTIGEQRAVRKLKKTDVDAAEVGVKIVAKHTHEWNWVDDDGNPMPQPDSSDVIDLLWDDELEFLRECIFGSEDEAKN